MSRTDNIVIASRKYYLDPASDSDTITVSIELPRRVESGYCECHFRFDGSERRTRFAAGIDEIHALVCALAMIGTDLDHLNREKYDGKLQWAGGAAHASLPTIRDSWPFVKVAG